MVHTVLLSPLLELKKVSLHKFLYVGEGFGVGILYQNGQFGVEKRLAYAEPRTG